MLNEDQKNYQKEQSQLLKAILNQRFFTPWSYDLCDNYSLKNDAGLEIYITNICNQHCQYCYLVKYPELYPINNADQDIILNNLRILYQWIIDNNFHIFKGEFFTGEIWHTPFGWKVLDITLEYLQKGMRIDWFLTATNFSFIFTDEALQKMNYYIRKFKECGHNLILSCSCDGAIVEQYSRPVNSGRVRDEEYWDRMFDFCRVHDFAFHPMVSANNVKDWIENYKWWKKRCEQAGMYVGKYLCTLEVRNSDWTDEAIEDYCKYLDFLLLDRLEHVGGDKEKFASQLLGIRTDIIPVNKPNEIDIGYACFGMPDSDTFYGCTVCTDLTVRLGDLAICPCHRTSYNQYLYGHFVVENNKIVDIEANNVEMATKILMGNIQTCTNKCDMCFLNQHCLHGCIGSQIETTGDPFFPSENVCKFFKAKYSFLLKRYEELGVIDFLKTITPYERDYLRAVDYLELYDNWKRGLIK